MNRVASEARKRLVVMVSQLHADPSAVKVIYGKKKGTLALKSGRRYQCSSALILTS
jgi:hypothetical protein